MTHIVLQPAYSDWQSQLSDVITSVDELLNILQLTHLKPSLYEAKHFPLRVPRAFVQKMTIGDENDPLLRQILPVCDEQYQVSGYVSDPLAESQYNPTKGLLHKYRSRVLLTVTGACAIHCRYCFRQHFDYHANLPVTSEQARIQTYLQDHPEINEVILSGGDPLSLSNRRLLSWLKFLGEMPQIKTIRLHTRLPVVIAERIDEALLSGFCELTKKCRLVMVIHCNHPQEIDDNLHTHLKKLQNIGITLLNQAVLLANINDDINTQVRLSEKLFSVGVMPYYLHLLDKVSGTAHFDCLEKQAVELYWLMLEALPGYLVPKLVKELPNKPFKTPINIYQ